MLLEIQKDLKHTKNMSKYSKWRIVEKNHFYIQKKSWYGWHYHYNLERSSVALIGSTIIFLVVGIIHIDEMITAKRFIDQLIATKERDIKENAEKKLKAKNKKIHYLDIQTERKEKLNSLKK